MLKKHLDFINVEKSSYFVESIAQFILQDFLMNTISDKNSIYFI